MHFVITSGRVFKQGTGILVLPAAAPITNTIVLASNLCHMFSPTTSKLCREQISIVGNRCRFPHHYIINHFQNLAINLNRQRFPQLSEKQVGITLGGRNSLCVPIKPLLCIIMCPLQQIISHTFLSCGQSGMPLILLQQYDFLSVEISVSVHLFKVIVKF